MKLGDDILKILGQIYEPDAMVKRHIGRYDMIFKTDAVGRPVLLFLGKAGEHGKIKGERFARRLITGPDGKVMRDHWDNKEKV